MATGSSIKECPRCGGKMQSRYYPEKLNWYLACNDLEHCGYTEAEPTDSQMLREGHAQLPGF